MRLDWESAPRDYDVGVDQGVLYFKGSHDEAVTWSGLISVTQQVQVSSATPRYFDGAVFTLEQKIEDYVANVEAYTYPYMLEDHILALSDMRTFVGASPELQPFGFTYRTMTSNGYKIHLVYNVTALIDPLVYETVSQNISPQPFKFKLHTVPVEVPGARPTAHFIIDSTRIENSVLLQIEDVLYGSEDTMPRFPTIDELIALFTAGEGTE